MAHTAQRKPAAVRNPHIAGLLMHGTEWDGAASFAGWHLSEKLDGVRAWWTGRELFTRDGRLIADVPAHILRQLPAGLALDGELYAGRGQFETARQAAQLGRWTPEVQFIAFDCPGSQAPDLADRLIEAIYAGARTIELRTAPTADVLRLRLQHLHRAGGEGFMLHQPGRAYGQGRVGHLLKFKDALLYADTVADIA